MFKQECKKKNDFPLQKRYIVADYWHDVGRLRIPWSKVCPESKKSTKLRLGSRHPELPLSKREIREIMDKLKKMTERQDRGLNLNNTLCRNT